MLNPPKKTSNENINYQGKKRKITQKFLNLLHNKVSKDLVKSQRMKNIRKVGSQSLIYFPRKERIIFVLLITQYALAKTIRASKREICAFHSNFGQVYPALRVQSMAMHIQRIFQCKISLSYVFKDTFCAFMQALCMHPGEPNRPKLHSSAAQRESRHLITHAGTTCQAQRTRKCVKALRIGEGT